MSASCFSPIPCQLQYQHGDQLMPRHRHDASYLALVLSGRYEEAGDRGRFQVGAGDIVVHGAFEAHLNRYISASSLILNIPLHTWQEPEAPLMQLADPDSAARLAERDPRAAAAYVLANMRAATLPMANWPDQLAAALAQDPHLRLQSWARQRGLADATVSRGFYKVFGISPSAYRAQLRGRLAWRQIVAGAQCLPDIAIDCGFADQSHMTRTVAAVTGRSPGAWRNQVK